VLAALILGSFLTLVIIAKVWAALVWKAPVRMGQLGNVALYEHMSRYRQMGYLLPIVLLSLTSLYIAFGAEHIQLLSEGIADDLRNPDKYIETVLGTKQNVMP